MAKKIELQRKGIGAGEEKTWRAEKLFGVEENWRHQSPFGGGSSPLVFTVGCRNEESLVLNVG